MSNYFEKQYWEKMYSKEKNIIIDGIENSNEHIDYLFSTFNLVQFKVNSILDIGFGKGLLLKKAIRKFKPKKITGIEPSEYIFKRTSRKFKNINLINTNLEKFYTKEIFDLGICNSVLQYIPDVELKDSIKKLSKYVKYLYLSVPTNTEYKIMKKEIKFIDPYAIQRTKEEYLNVLKPYFRIVSFQLLESKINMKKSIFTTEIFRYE